MFRKFENGTLKIHEDSQDEINFMRTHPHCKGGFNAVESIVEEFAKALRTNTVIAEMLINGEIPMNVYERGVLKEIEAKKLALEAASIASDEQ